MSDAASANALGKVIKTEGSCYKYDTFNNRWVRLNESDVITENDILTSESVSESVICLNDGSRLCVEENARVSVTEDNDSYHIKMNGDGTVIADTMMSEKELFLQCGQFNEVKLEPKSAVSLSVRNHKLTAAVYEGCLVTVISDGVENSAGKGSGYIVNEENSIQRLPVVVTSPVSEFWKNAIDEECRIKFEWTKNNNSIEYIRIEISSDSAFKSVIKTIFVDADKLNDEVLLSQGLWYWRLCSVDAEGKIKEPSEKFQSGRIHLK